MRLRSGRFIYSRGLIFGDAYYRNFAVFSTKLNARLALRQRADLFKANISANKISLPQGQSYTEFPPV